MLWLGGLMVVACLSVGLALHVLAAGYTLLAVGLLIIAIFAILVYTRYTLDRL